MEPGAGRAVGPLLRKIVGRIRNSQPAVPALPAVISRGADCDIQIAIMSDNAPVTTKLKAGSDAVDGRLVDRRSSQDFGDMAVFQDPINHPYVLLTGSP
jgi:hypothetical protein